MSSSPTSPLTIQQQVDRFREGTLEDFDKDELAAMIHCTQRALYMQANPTQPRMPTDQADILEATLQSKTLEELRQIWMELPRNSAQNPIFDESN